jgi:uncharacterized membrane protein YkvA (DUF1232 family)
VSESASTVDATVVDSTVVDEGLLRRMLRRAGRTVARPAVECLELLLDGQTPHTVRLTMLAALTYLLVPTDLIPDFLPIAGFSDDVVALTALWAWFAPTSPRPSVTGPRSGSIAGSPDGRPVWMPGWRGAGVAMAPSPPGLDPDQLQQLEDFLKDWLRHCGRTQADLRRALRASSIRMPALLQELQRTVQQAGLSGLADRLCGIEGQWQLEMLPAGAPAPADDLAQLDLLLREIRDEAA